MAALGGTPEPLLDAIKAGKIRGAVGIVGCNNPKIKHDYGHVNLTKRLIENDVLVVDTGCVSVANAKAGFKVPEAIEMAGPGLKEVCGALGIPPVLHLGSCVDNVRILVLVSALADALGVDISDLPVAGAAPEWYSEKAVTIGTYFVASGVTTVLGPMPPIAGSMNVVKLLTEGLKGRGRCHLCRGTGSGKSGFDHSQAHRRETKGPRTGRFGGVTRKKTPHFESKIRNAAPPDLPSLAYDKFHDHACGFFRIFFPGNVAAKRNHFKPCLGQSLFKLKANFLQNPGIIPKQLLSVAVFFLTIFLWTWAFLRWYCPSRCVFPPVEVVV